MQLAIEFEKIEIVKSFLEKGADPNLKNKDGDTPLMIVRDKGNKDMESLLVKYGAK